MATLASHSFASFLSASAFAASTSASAAALALNASSDETWPARTALRRLGEPGPSPLYELAREAPPAAKPSKATS